MKVDIDGVEVITLTDTQKNVIKNDINADVFQNDMQHRVKHALVNKYERCLQRLKKEWIENKDSNGKCKLELCGVSTMPLNDEALAEAIFALPEYNDRKARDEANAILP